MEESTFGWKQIILILLILAFLVLFYKIVTGIIG